VAAAQGGHKPAWLPQLLGAQFTAIGQDLLPFSAPYSGAHSLENTGDIEATHTYGVYLGSRVTTLLRVYLDCEMARGGAVSNAFGLAGVPNGDVIRQGSVELPQSPYVARAFAQVIIPLGAPTEDVGRAMDQLPGTQATTRLELKAGKLAVTDDFDQNRYANTTRSQFMNWGLFNNSAWDYAADTRGYSWGVVIGWVHPFWILNLGSFEMPTFANGNTFDTDVQRARGDNLQLTLRPRGRGSILRLLAFENHGRMGIYADAVAAARASGSIPDIVADDRPGRVKWGLAASLEQPLADSGETGLFVRAGWNDGRTEDFVFTEVDRHLSAGLQISGAHWKRQDDRVGVAALLHGLSAEHEAYLAAGGQGFLLGDGALSYGPETIVEGFYRLQLGRFVQLSADGQEIWNPGYNRARGPATVLSLRFNLRY